MSYSHEWHVQRHNCFGPRQPWGGAKRSNIIKFQLQRQLQRFLNLTLCIFSQMKDIKHMLPKATVPEVKGAYRHEEEGEVVAVSNINIYSSCKRSACYIKILTIMSAQNATLSTLKGK